MERRLSQVGVTLRCGVMMTSAGTLLALKMRSACGRGRRAGGRGVTPYEAAVGAGGEVGRAGMHPSSLSNHCREYWPG